MRYLLLLPVLFACTALPPAVQARVDVFECEAKVLAPVVEPVFNSEDLLSDLYAGRASLGRVLETLEVTPGEIQRLVLGLQACRGGAEADAPPEPQLEETRL